VSSRRGNTLRVGRSVNWVQSSIDVQGERVGLSLHRLDPDECERAAAAIAWFTLQAGMDDPEAWKDFLESVIFGHIDFTIAKDRLETLGQAWWDEATSRAAGEFVRVNDLGPSCRRFIEVIERNVSTLS